MSPGPGSPLGPAVLGDDSTLSGLDLTPDQHWALRRPAAPRGVIVTTARLGQRPWTRNRPPNSGGRLIESSLMPASDN
jgi:hypothetical protein